MASTTGISFDREVKSEPPYGNIDYNQTLELLHPNPTSESDREIAGNNETLKSFYHREDLSPGEYLPDISIARITKHVWIDHPTASQTWVNLEFSFYNPYETYARYFRIYLDGQKVYEEVDSTTRHSGTVAQYLSDGPHEIIFEVRHGAYSKGWALEYAYIENGMHSQVHTSADLGGNEAMPQIYVSQIQRKVFVNDGSGAFDERIRVAVESDDPYHRYLRLRVNGQLVHEVIIYQSYETTVDVSSYMPDADIYEVELEIKAGHYRQWQLVYLGLERSESKYVPLDLQLIVSVEWNPSDEYLNDFIAGLHEFVAHAWDAFEEQLIITRIDIYTGGQMWNDPDTNVNVHWLNNFTPYAVMQFSKDPQGNPIQGSLRGLGKIHLPRYWPHDSGTWTGWLSYLAITHELAHAFFHLADEYVTGPDIDPPQEAVCRPPYEDASIMDAASNWEKTEFCTRLNHDPDGDTAQSWWWALSCWGTIAEFNPQVYEPYPPHTTVTGSVAADYVNIILH